MAPILPFAISEPHRHRSEECDQQSNCPAKQPGNCSERPFVRAALKPELGGGLLDLDFLLVLLRLSALRHVDSQNTVLELGLDLLHINPRRNGE